MENFLTVEDSLQLAAGFFNALGIVKKEQPTVFVVMKMETPYTWPSFSFYESFLFFLYDPLCMSLRDVVAADDPWSG